MADCVATSPANRQKIDYRPATGALQTRRAPSLPAPARKGLGERSRGAHEGAHAQPPEVHRRNGRGRCRPGRGLAGVAGARSREPGSASAPAHPGREPGHHPLRDPRCSESQPDDVGPSVRIPRGLRAHLAARLQAGRVRGLHAERRRRRRAPERTPGSRLPTSPIPHPTQRSCPGPPRCAGGSISTGSRPTARTRTFPATSTQASRALRLLRPSSTGSSASASSPRR